jgi:hypothetical protein
MTCIAGGGGCARNYVRGRSVFARKVGKLELSRAHTPRAAAASCNVSICREMRAAAVCLLTTFTCIDYVKLCA